MTDYIERQAAIDAFLTELTKRERKNLLHTWSTVEVKYFVVEMLEQLPSAQPDSKELSSTHKALDTISRQAAVDICNNAIDLWHGQLGEGIVIAVKKKIEELPSAQPDLPEWAHKVEEYRKSAPSFVRNQLVWALYQTWKEYDGRLFNHSRAERRTDEKKNI